MKNLPYMYFRQGSPRYILELIWIQTADPEPIWLGEDMRSLSALVHSFIYSFISSLKFPTYNLINRNNYSTVVNNEKITDISTNSSPPLRFAVCFVVYVQQIYSKSAKYLL